MKRLTSEYPVLAQGQPMGEEWSKRCKVRVNQENKPSSPELGVHVTALRLWC